MKLQNLLYKKRGKIIGAMSPVLFAKEVCEKMGEKFHGLCRVVFDDDLVHNSLRKRTYYDTLVMLERFKNDNKLAMWIDTGTAGIPVAMMLESNRELIVTPAYRNNKRIKQLSDDEIREIFNKIFDDMSVIIPQERR